MSHFRTMKSSIHRACPEPCRRDGWTPARQLRFLDALARTRCVTRAAIAAGMSRESAYRLRRRPAAALFAAAWDRAIQGHRFVNIAEGLLRRENRLSPRQGHKVEEVHDPRYSLTPLSSS